MPLENLEAWRPVLGGPNDVSASRFTLLGFISHTFPKLRSQDPPEVPLHVGYVDHLTISIIVYNITFYDEIEHSQNYEESDHENQGARSTAAMSVFGLERSQTDGAQTYDHAINLVDTTRPKESLDEEGLSPSSSLPRSDSGTLLNRQWTKGGLQKQLAQRKYAKYQEGKDDNSGSLPESGDESGNTEVRTSQEGEPRKDGGRTGRLRDKIPFRKKAKAKSREKVDTFIDVLYENQRGSFLCGIPLYSSNSLLNFDPSPWQTANFKDSAVNITNFQLPDPSWIWDWKTWYVDMSHDVDDEGWEYSFSFNSVYSWHGTHPFLYSFVRRRRWLRRRVRIHPHRADGKKSSMKNAHLLNEDYFTIHTGKRSRSRDSSADRSTNNQSSVMPEVAGGDEGEEEFGDINDVSALMAALRRSRVDREKIAAVKVFLEQGGDELFYLAEKIPEIMAIFVHQTSCRQLQSYLLQVLDETTNRNSKDETKGNGKDDSDTSLTTQKRKIDNLLKAINAAGVHVNDIHYWSDLRDRATNSEAGPTDETHALDASEPTEVTGDLPHAHSDDDEKNVREEIKGIPKDAHVSEAPRIQFSNRRSDSSDSQDSARGPLDKGKGKA